MNPYSTIIVDQDASPTPPAPVQPAAPAAAPDAAKGSGTATATAPAHPKTPPVRKPLDQYKVLLHNDDVHEMLFVVQTIVEVVPMAARKAFTVMAEAHQTGVALVTVTHLELAELYRDRFQSKGLTSTIEKA
ncbi:MAG TPA: ATP-dependent Clp protease adaptor ClpS [Phycisphaerales bacterium]|nr:ATP-dependent Clp protease adaptor ClpS [Phycisphaerales bacterium]